MRWSQWIDAGTAVLTMPHVMNWRRAICADASCMATRSGFSLRASGHKRETGDGEHEPALERSFFALT